MSKLAKVSINLLLLTFIFLLLPFNFSLVYATATVHCIWHATYFDVIFVNNYGRSQIDYQYPPDIITRANVVMQLDSLFRTLRKEGKLEHFKRWLLMDDYMKNYSVDDGSFIIEGKKVYINLTDSVAINKALKKLWGIENVTISLNKRAGMWLFSLHVGLSETRLGARYFPHGGYIYERPDSTLLWLQCHPDPSAAHSWYQHETDGYYHMYTGLYLSKQNVIKAQRLLLEHSNLKTTIVSQYITSAIIKKYAFQ